MYGFEIQPGRYRDVYPVRPVATVAEAFFTTLPIPDAAEFCPRARDSLISPVSVLEARTVTDNSIILLIK